MLMKVKCPVHKFNAAIRDGSIGQKMGRILETCKPKAAYFTAEKGCRGGTFVVDMSDPKQMPLYAEPWFLYFDAEVEYLPFMTPEELVQAGLEKLNDMWP